MVLVVNSIFTNWCYNIYGGKNEAKVNFTKEITSASLVKIHESLGVDLKGKVGVKISTGELGGHNFLNPKLIEKLVKKLNGAIIECCTAYGGKRQDPLDHWQAFRKLWFYFDVIAF